MTTKTPTTTLNTDVSNSSEQFSTNLKIIDKVQTRFTKVAILSRTKRKKKLVNRISYLEGDEI